MSNKLKVISDKFKDIPEHDRIKVIDVYFTNPYNRKEDLKYICLHHTDNIIEQKKISGQVSIKQAPVIDRNTGKETGEHYNISKQSEFSKEFDDIFLLRLEMEKTGLKANEVHIKYNVIKNIIDNLSAKQKNNLNIISGIDDYKLTKRELEKLKKDTFQCIIDVLIDK